MERVWGAPDLLRLAGVLALSLLFLCVWVPARAAPLRVGLDSNYPPFSRVDRRGHASGFDLEVAEELCQAMGRQCEFVFLPLDGLLAAASVIEEPSHWSGDGVHPNEAGSRLIGRYYAEAFAAMLGK